MKQLDSFQDSNLVCWLHLRVYFRVCHLGPNCDNCTCFPELLFLTHFIALSLWGWGLALLLPSLSCISGFLPSYLGIEYHMLLICYCYALSPVGTLGRVVLRPPCSTGCPPFAASVLQKTSSHAPETDLSPNCLPRLGVALFTSTGTSLDP